ncbi:hypothetical protein ACFLWA_01630 [Chloroflexota bacterium]
MTAQTEHKNKLSRVTGIVSALAVLSFSVLAAGIVLAYMSEYGQRRIAAAVAIAAAGSAMAFVAYLLVTRTCRSRRSSILVLSLLVLLLLVPILSIVYPGQVTYSRFGLTVYGAIPVPSLDIAVGTDGIL